MKKFALSPMQGTVLRLLDEAGAEDLACTANSVFPEEPSVDIDAFLGSLSRALSSLVRQGLVILERVHEHSGLGSTLNEGNTIARVLCFSATMRWEEAAGCFTWMSPWPDGDRVEVLLTMKGAEAIRM